MEPKWLTVQMVTAAHAEAIKTFGGSDGVRDQRLLESALERPRNLHAYGDDPSIFQFAAAYTVGIVKNHPFIDGNKRAGLLAAISFLDLNGYVLSPKEEDVVAVMVAVAESKADESFLAGWFSDFSIRKKA